ncbi:MAG: cyclophane-forming radical SAM/SPASM peptide maturase GrrM/OscB [Microcoleaceae cyanobacterium]
MTNIQLTTPEQSLSDLDIANFGPMQLIVIQPTTFCNLNCDYCYLPDRQLKKRLDLDLIEPIFRNIFTSQFLGECFTICWHAGEPLAVPISFYQSALDLIAQTSEKYNTHNSCFDHSVQTNATLITPAWCEFFAKHNFHVGVSIDGPAFIHDRHRKTLAGQNSHELTLRGIKYLQDYQIESSTISVITEDTLDYPEQMFDFFWENGITDIGFNMEETEGIHQQTSLNYKQETEERYRAFMQRFWQLVAQTDGKMQVREFETICSFIYTGDRQQNTDMNYPFSIVSIDHQGNFATFDPELLSVKTAKYGDFVLGNVLTDTFESVCQTAKFQQIYHDMRSGVEQCQATCQYFGVCGGGAGSNKFWENGSFNSTMTQACRYRTQIITDVVLNELEAKVGIQK